MIGLGEQETDIFDLILDLKKSMRLKVGKKETLKNFIYTHQNMQNHFIKNININQIINITTF